MPKVTEEYIANKKKKIVDAAYALCLRKTVSTVTMQDIINETGLSQGGIYCFYKDIDEIFSDMIVTMRKRVNLKENIDNILLHQDKFSPFEITEQIFDMMTVFLQSELMEIEKIDFELSVLAMNAPARVHKIMKGTPGVGNMQYITLRMMEYYKEQVWAGKIHPQISVEELLSFISAAYSGIRMLCIEANCYKHEENVLVYLYQPETQLKMLAKTVNLLLGEEVHEEG